MARLEWDAIGEHFYETGVSKGVLYLAETNIETGKTTYPKGVVWNGLTSVSESPDGGDAEDFYADNIKYLTLRGVENLNGSINAYTYPDEFMLCDGSAKFGNIAGVILHQQPRRMFGLSYVTNIGNDVTEDYGLMYHLLYGCTVSPSDREYSTINDSPEPIEFSWDFSTQPVNVGVGDSMADQVTGANVWKPTSLITIKSKLLTVDQNKALQDALWGSSDKEAYLPLPATLFGLLQSAG